MKNVWRPLQILSSVILLTAECVQAAEGSPAPGTPPPGIEIVAEFDLNNPPGNVAVTPDGRIFMSLHGFYAPEFRVVEVLEDSTTRPFPNRRWASAPGADGIGLNSVLGLRADADGIVWMLDNAGQGQDAKIVAWDTRSNSLHRIIPIGAAFVPDNGFLNDLVLDLEHDAIYITDTIGMADGLNKPALIVIQQKTGEIRRVLEGHVSTLAEDVNVAPEGRIVTVGGNPVRVAVDSIALDTAHEWLYYGPLSGRTLYRVRTDDLLDASLTSEALASRVEVYANKPVSDGLIIDAAGNIYVTDINASAIGVIGSDRRYRILWQDNQTLSWPDGFAFGPEDMIYVTVNQLNRSPVLRGDGPAAEPPFYLLRFQALAPERHLQAR